ncbi:hypothetical protein QTN79_01970 [Candidatus Saccharibacteria bacterium oral taxon 488]|jgi:hypothetical protein
MNKAEFLGRCKDCPIAGPACENVENRRQAAKEAAKLALKGLSNNPNIQLFRGDGVQVDVADLDPKVLEELNKDLRSQVAGCFDEIDESRNYVLQLAEKCPGPTTARFRAKTGRLVEVTVCDSAALPWQSSGEGNIEPVRVRRRS